MCVVCVVDDLSDSWRKKELIGEIDPWAVAPDDGPAAQILCDSPSIERTASLSFKQPRVPCIRVLGRRGLFVPPIDMAKQPITSQAVKGPEKAVR